MPISFEPQQAFDQNIATAYGASQARQQANELALRAYGITQASADRRSEMAQQEEQFNASFRQKFQLQDSAQAHDFAQAQQHTDLQAQLSQTQLNQAENMRLQRLDRQIEYVQANAGPGQQYSQQEAQEMIGDLRMNRDPLDARAKRAQILQTQAATQHAQDQHAQITTMQSIADNFRANATRGGIVEHKREDGTVWGVTLPDGRGGFHTQVVPPPPKDTTEITPQIRARFATTARAEQTREEQFAARAGQPAPAWVASPQLRDLDRERRVNEMIRDHSGGGGATRGDAATDRAGFASEVAAAIQAARQPSRAPAMGGQMNNASRAAPPAPPPGYSGPVDSAQPGEDAYASPYGQ